MKKSKKNLVMIVTAFMMLAIFIFANKSLNNNEVIVKDNTEGINKNINNAKRIENESTNINDTSEGEEETILFEKEVSINQSDIDEDLVAEIDKLISKYYEKSNAIEDDILITEEQPVDEDQTTELITKKREAIEAYKNIVSYVKPGLEKNTYIVFSTYDIKLYNISTMVPGMSSLHVIKDEAGVLRINNSTIDTELMNYINQLTTEGDIKNLIEEVNSKLEELVKKDDSLKEFVDYINDIS